MKRWITYGWLALPLLLAECNPTKYVPEEQYLLHKYKIEAGEGPYDKRELNSYIKQKPNKRIFFWKFYLSLYNLSNPDKENGFQNWLRRIGEPPVIYDPDLKSQTAEQLRLYMHNKGFYQSEVSDTTHFRRQRARVVYRVEPGKPYRIREIDYFFHDATLAPLVLADTGSTNLRKGRLFDVDALQQERERIEALLRDSGYYAFNRDYIYYQVDSSNGSYQVDLTLGVRNYPETGPDGSTVHVDHPVYHIRNVHLVTDYDAVTERGFRSGFRLRRDSVRFDSVYVVSSGKPNIRPGMVTQKNYIIPGDRFDASSVQRTYRNLSSLSAARLVDIRFREVEGEEPRLDADVLITPATRQTYAIQLEGTNSGGNIGAAVNLGYGHRNLFGGSERFDLTFKGAIETLQRSGQNAETESERGLDLMQEFGVDARLRFPRFLLPIPSDRFIRRYNPQTNIRLTYNYQRRPDYVRTVATTSFGYDWKGSPRTTHRVFPLEASLILTPFKSDEFKEWLEGKYLFYSYEPHLIIDSRYSLNWSNQKLLKNQSFQDIRFNVETAGNLLYSGFSLFADDPGDDAYQLLGVDFAQYLKADVDVRSFNVLYEDISLVFRGFVGAGYAYLNSTAMPFEKQYFAGGANSIRAWQVKSLGPGSYRDTLNSAYPNQTGDVKLEFNAEYRFKLFWKLEAALFIDAGNIWSLSPEDDREGAGFEFNRFYRELAVGTGFGTRAVFNFFVFRFDLGVPLRSPYPLEGSHWLPGNAGVRGRDLTFNLAIGYPF